MASNQLVFWAPTDYYSGPSWVKTTPVQLWFFCSFVDYGLASLSAVMCLVRGEQPTCILGTDYYSGPSRVKTAVACPAQLCLSFCKLWAGFSYDEVMCLVRGKQPTRILGTHRLLLGSKLGEDHPRATLVLLFICRLWAGFS